MDLAILKYALSINIYFTFLMILIDVMKKYYKFAAYFWIASLLTIPLWLMDIEGWFRWTKTRWFEWQLHTGKAEVSFFLGKAMAQAV